MKRMLVGAFLLAAALPLAAETVYRWVDAQGGVHFSATPPPGQAVDEEKLRYQRNPDPAAATEAQQQMQQSIGERRAAEARAAETAAAKGKADAARRARCDDARAIVNRLQGSRNVRYRQDDGSFRMYTQDEWQQKMDQALKVQRENCG